PAASPPAAAGRLARLWPRLPAIALGVALAAFAFAVLLWVLRNPEIAGWDELGYVDEVRHDSLLLAQQGWGALRDSLFIDYRQGPPGIRLVGLPAALAGFGDAASLRLLSALLIAATAGMLGLAAASVAGRGAGLLAAALFLAAPGGVRAGQEFMSETLAIPALAATLLLLAREWARPEPPRWNAALLGLAVGAGLLARLSFAVQLLPAAVLAIGLGLLFDRHRLRRLGIVAFFALLVAWPAYAVNGLRYLGYARGAVADWQGHRLVAEGGGEFALRWLGRIVADHAFGPLVTLALLLGAAGLLVLAARGLRWRRPPPALLVAGFALALAAPVLAGHVTGQNQNFRFLASALPGLAVAAAIGIAAGLPRPALGAAAAL
ncbi:hypothetical protein E2C05_31925, partial [Paracraurococcus ruber]|uniref:glycosyltransferase family 39 protein n=1 Tax=Paracraurococcus ruber TaxID=77675 RepID=UPI00186423A0